MQPDEALDLLPPLYAVALRLADAGAAPTVIATAAGIELESVPGSSRSPMRSCRRSRDEISRDQ